MDSSILVSTCLAPQAKTSLQLFGASWGALEAQLAGALHDTLVASLQGMPWDAASHAVAYRHMPEASRSKTLEVQTVCEAEKKKEGSCVCHAGVHERLRCRPLRSMTCVATLAGSAVNAVATPMSGIPRL